MHDEVAKYESRVLKLLDPDSCANIVPASFVQLNKPIVNEAQNLYAAIKPIKTYLVLRSFVYKGTTVRDGKPVNQILSADGRAEAHRLMHLYDQNGSKFDIDRSLPYLYMNLCIVYSYKVKQNVIYNFKFYFDEFRAVTRIEKTTGELVIE
jgi:hypothetical protein